MAHAPNMPSPVALPGVSKIVAIGSGKGGVGKTTVAVNLAIALSRLGQRVGLIDADIYGPNVPLMMGSAQQPAVGPGNQIIPNLTHGIKTISPVQTVPLTGAVVVSTPSDVSLQDARKALEMFAQVNVEVLGIVENMSHFTCPHCGEVIDIFSKGGAERTAQQFGIPFLGSIELIPAIREGGDKGLPITLAGPESALAAEFYEVARKLTERAEDAASRSGEVIEIS